MPFIPHTDQDIQEMLEVMAVESIEALFNEIPNSLRNVSLAGIPEGMSEMALGRLMRERAAKDEQALCFIGAGAYEHHIPAAVWEIATRGEFMTAYTPYQAEASQGSLQLLYEYQSMMASLMAMQVSNASLYDGASALAEAILMAVRLKAKQGKESILMPATVNPYYRETVKTIIKQQHITIIDVDYEKATGKVDRTQLNRLLTDDVAACVIPQPNFFGVLEDVNELADWTHEKDILSIAVVNPMAMALLKPPGKWGAHGVDIACGEGQPLGIPLASGGPYFGFLCCKKNHVRQMPGRLVGLTEDIDGKPGYVLTLQAREQHIRRAKATSNICTNQGLMVTAATIYMSLMGPQGLRRVALACHQRARELYQALTSIRGIVPLFHSSFFHEIALSIPRSVDETLHDLASCQIQGGYALNATYPELKNGLLICATETKTREDIQLLTSYLRQIVEKGKSACHA